MSAKPCVVLAFAPGLNVDLFGDAQRERLHALAEVPDPEPLSRFDEARAEVLLGRADVLLSGWGCPPLADDVLALAPRLRAVIHAAGTVKNHVGEAVFERGIAVTSAVAANAIPVAQYAVAAILFAAKGVFALRERYREVRAFRLWARELPGAGALGKTIGIVGASHIGRLVLEQLAPHGFRLLLHDPTLAVGEAEKLGASPAALDDLLRESDVVSLHAPLLPETRHLLDAARLALLRDGVTLVNTARGALVDSVALEAELVSGRLAAVIDTTEPEILPASSPLYALPNVFLTPHIAGAIGRETQRLADLALDELERFARGESFRHAITREAFARIA